MAAFDSIHVVVDGTAKIEIDALHMRRPEFSAAPAIIVRAPTPELIEELEPALRRGNFKRTQPALGTGDEALQTTLKTRVDLTGFACSRSPT